MPRCGCSGSSSCVCVVRANAGATVTGDGSVGDPFVVNVQYAGSGLAVSTMERYEANNASSVLGSAGTLYLTALTAREDLSSTGIRMYSGNAGFSGGPPTLVRMGLYIIDGERNGTLVASTPNDNTLFAAANTAYSKNWSVPYDVVKGMRYYVALLFVSSFTSPSVVSSAQVSAIQGETGAEPYAAARILLQPDLPSSFIFSQLAASPLPNYARLF